MKTKHLIALAILFALVPAPLAFAASLSEEQSTKISMNCSSIRQNLKNLQRADSRTRTYFGAIYETVANKYLKPLNLRLVNNDLADSSLSKLQISLATARNDFHDDFIVYSKALEELSAIDCRLAPEDFYEKLLDTRKKRAVVAKDTKVLNQLLTEAVKNAERLKENLNAGQ